jgi:two-component system, NtrC family, response regulator GlrR
MANSNGTAPGMGVKVRPTREIEAQGAPHALVQRFHLVVVDGPDAGKTFTSSPERTIVGTDVSADVILGDDTVSRLHCELFPGDARVEVRDLGSLNGTAINGVSVVRGYAPPGAVLTLGNTRIRIGPRAEDARLPLSRGDRFGTMVGRSTTMRRVFALLERAAASDATVLLQGETGTGKEAAAESIHAASARRDGPFIVVDCGAIPANLLESELFGHEKGAFTGAVARRAGAFEAASGGTIFLDEMGELPLDLQVKVLRVLESRKVKSVG